MQKINGVMRAVYLVDALGYGQMWTLCASVMLPEVVSESKLQHAANELFRINDELRVRFVEDPVEGEVYQEIKPYEEQQFEVLHFGSKAELDDFGNKYAAVPLELDVRPLDKKRIPNKYWLDLYDAKMTFQMIMLGLKESIGLFFKKRRIHVKSVPAVCEIKLVQLPNASGAIVKVHHVVSDAWSMSLMANQFLQILNGETPVVYQYSEHLDSDEAYRKTKAYQKDLAFFNEQLEKCEPAVPSVDQKAKRKTITLDDNLSSQIMAYSLEHNLTPYTLFLTAMSIYVRCKVGQEKFFMGSTCGNRIGNHEKNMVGMFFSVPAMLLELDDNASFADTLVAVNTANFGAMRHQRASCDVINASPYKYVVSYQNAKIDANPDATCTQYYCDYFGYCMLTAEDRAMEGRFKLHLDYNLELCPSDQEMDELLDYVVAVIRAGIADDSKTVKELVS